MRMEENFFPHIILPIHRTGRYKSRRVIGVIPEQTEENKRNRTRHSRRLGGQLSRVSDSWTERMGYRPLDSPEIPAGVPMLLKVDSDEDIEWLIRTFKFEIVSQDPDGYVIISSTPTNLENVSKRIGDFSEEIRGSGNVARIHEILDDENRIERILSEDLLRQWPALRDDDSYTVDISIECIGTIIKPEQPVRTLSETQEAFDRRFEDYRRSHPDRDLDQYKIRNPRREEESEEDFERKISVWRDKCAEAEEGWDSLKDEREAAIIEFVSGYDGEILDLYESEARSMFRFPDSLGARIRISGIGLRDLVNNFPFLFEVSLPEKYEHPHAEEIREKKGYPQPTIIEPDDEAPCVCIIDSGIQEEHILLEPAIDKSSSISLIGQNRNDVADYVSPGGHGTRVAGAVLYKEEIPDEGEVTLPFWLQNARVMNRDCKVPDNLYPPKYILEIVNRFLGTPRSTRLYNHSINAWHPCRMNRMSTWAAAIDLISYEKDVLFFQSTGNLPDDSEGPIIYGVIQHLAAGRTYPQYLTMLSCRISNPAQSLQALTVGSVGYGDGDGMIPFGGIDEPSSYSKTGLGIWDSIKPDVVEYGGDSVHDGGNPPRLLDRPLACPDLVRSTMYAPGPSHDRDTIGTSFATPKVAHIAAHIQAVLPNEPALLYRALIAQSARWPDWTSSREPFETIRQIGYGIPNLERATSNSPFRITMITHGLQEIGPRNAHIFQVPVPAALRKPEEAHVIRLDVTLSYSAKPRRTRMRLRGYLSTWLTWMVSKKEESLESFASRALADAEDYEPDGTGEILWTLRDRSDHGLIAGVRRGKSTLQKDWAFIHSFELPETLCIAVIGHQGWSNNPDDSAKYALAVSFEAIEQNIEIYERIKLAVETQVEVPLEVQI